jgi:DNA-binding transcriptional MerR regulator
MARRVDIGVDSKVYAGGMTLTVSKLADRVGLTADTIRYYERAGLLPPPDRTASGYRAFDDDDVERLRFIKGAQPIGLRLQEIKELLDIRDRGHCPCGHTEDLLRRRVSEIDAEITGLQETKAALLAFTERFSAIDCPEGVGPWPCAKEFIAAADGDRREVDSSWKASRAVRRRLIVRARRPRSAPKQAVANQDKPLIWDDEWR